MRKVRQLAVGVVGAVLLGQVASANVIISQYHEGLSNDKYIELANTGSSAIDLSAGTYVLGLFSNANREAWKTNGTPNGTLSLTGTLAAGSTLLLKNPSAAAPAYASSGATVSNGTVINFNGDDSVVLYTSSTFSTANVVDAFGVTASGFADTSYVRNTSVTAGTTSDFNAAQWTQFSLASVANASSTSNEYLGYHAIPEPASLGLVGFGGLLLLRRRSARA